MKITYSPYRYTSAADSFTEISEDDKEKFILSYLEFKTSRRITYYTHYTLKEIPEGEKFLDFKKGENYQYLACELQLSYKEDEA